LPYFTKEKIEIINISYHLLEPPGFQLVKVILANPIMSVNNGCIHTQFMTAMQFGSPIFSTFRIVFGKVAVFMQWESESAL
jgi:hypothetical protein